MKALVLSAALPALALALASCSGGNSAEASGQLSGNVQLDGSSTVYPITEAIAEEFGGVHPRVRVTVGVSGTGGGFKKFILGETDINDASRPIKPSEAEKAASNKIEFIELPVAYDGIAVVANKDNAFLDTITVDQLNRIWRRENPVKTWSELDSSWPAEEIKLYGPGTDSGTFDYFKEVIVGKKSPIRADFNASEDDNQLVTGVSGDPNGLGFFGFAYYVANKDRLKLIAVDGGNGPVKPSEATINDGSYSPLSRPLFLYVREASLENPAVAAFVDFTLDNVAQLAAEVGYVAVPDEIATLTRKRYQERTTGTMFGEHGGDKSLLEAMKSSK